MPADETLMDAEERMEKAINVLGNAVVRHSYRTRYTGVGRLR